MTMRNEHSNSLVALHIAIFPKNRRSGSAPKIEFSTSQHLLSFLLFNNNYCFDQRGFDEGTVTSILLQTMSRATYIMLFLLTMVSSARSVGFVLHGTNAHWGAKKQAYMINLMVYGACLTPFILAKMLTDANRSNNGLTEVVPRGTLRGWLDHYLWFGETPAETKTNKRYKRGGKKKMKEKHLKTLRDAIMDDPNLHLDELRAIMYGTYQKHWSCKTIWKYITDKKDGLNMSLQVITMSAVQASEYERMIYKNTLSAFDDSTAFMFVDETCVGRNDSRRRRCWSQRGTPPTQKGVFKDDEFDGEVYTMIGVVDINGFISQCCVPVPRKSSQTDSNVMHGTITQDYFVNWVDSILCKEIRRRVDLGMSTPVVVMDNASVHKHARIRKLIVDAGGELVWTAAYSPDLNPIERCFNQYKTFLKTYKWLYPNQLERHYAALTSVSRDNMINYYNGQALESCIQNVPNKCSSVSQKRKRSNYVAAMLSATS